MLPTKTKKPVVDLDASSDSSDSDRPNKKRRRPNGTPRDTPKKPASFTSNANDASYNEVMTWNYTELSRSNDRDRMLIKLLLDGGETYREDISKYLTKSQKESKEFVEQLRAGLETRMDGNSEANGLDVVSAKVILDCADLFIAWFHCKRDFMLAHARPDDTSWWRRLIEDKMQHGMFKNRLQVLIQRRRSKLFVQGKRHLSWPPVVVVISDDDSNTNHATPHKKRKRVVERSKAAEKSRTIARDRLERHKGLMRAESNPTHLAAGSTSDPSQPKIPINLVAKDAGLEVIYIPPIIAQKMKPHQIEGAQFLWREITTVGEESSQGCLLAHTMGLGKTMQTIAVLVALAEASQNPQLFEQLPSHLRLSEEDREKRQLRMLILCPSSLIENWTREIDMWAPEAVRHVVTVRETDGLLGRVEKWYNGGGVLLIGYGVFRNAIMRKSRKSTKAEGGRIEHVLLKDGPRIDEILLRGPDVVVADEAHNLKNDKSDIALAASLIKTETRVALTGTPMSNDVQEIYALVSWIAPGYLGNNAEFKDRYAEPIKEGLYEDSTKTEVRKSIVRLKTLHEVIEPKVHRADITVLRGTLKPKVEFVVTVPLTDLQDQLYRRYIQEVRDKGQASKVSEVQIFSWLAVLMLLTNHPRAFKRKMLDRASKKDPSATQTGTSGSNTPDVTIIGDPDFEKAVTYGDQDVLSLGFTEETVQSLVEELDDSVNPNLSAKTMILLDILHLSKECGDRVIVFSGSIATLDYLQDLFDHQNIRFGIIQGKTMMPKRMKILEDFNKVKFDVMLVSTRAGGVGLNMQCANRVVIFDFGFNPSHEEQAIGRAYRFGQEKPVYVYRFVAGGTFETNLDNRQLFKASLAQRVVDKKNPRRSAMRNTKEWLYELKPVKQENLSEWIGKDPNVLDKILDQEGIATSLHSSSMIRAIKTMETLQAEVNDAPLTDEELIEVAADREEWTRLRQGLRQYPAPPTFIPTQSAFLAPSSTAPSLYGQPGPYSWNFSAIPSQSQAHGHPATQGRSVMNLQPVQIHGYTADQPAPSSVPHAAGFTPTQPAPTSGHPTTGGFQGAAPGPNAHGFF